MDAWSTRRWRAASVALLVAAALLCTWPLATELAGSIPLGTESAPTIPIFDLWTLWWSADRLAHAYAALWNAPIFHPVEGAFAFSEPLLLPGAVAAPFFAAGAPLALTYNLVLIAALVANGVFATRLARALGNGRSTALLTGILMVALPFVAKMHGELPVVSFAGILAALDALVRFGRDGRTRYLIAAGAAVIAQALMSEQLALLSLPFLFAAAIVAAVERRGSRSDAGRLAGAAVATGLVLYLLAREPLAIHERFEFHRSTELVDSLSAGALDYFSRPQSASLSFPPREDARTFTGGLFPGLLLFALAALGAMTRPEDSRVNRWRWYAAASCAAAACWSMGLPPFSALRLLPGFSQIRSLFRAAGLAQIQMVVLASLGLTELSRRFRGSKRQAQIVACAGVLAAVENLSIPAPLLSVPSSARTRWSAFVAAQPPDTVIVHVPFPRGREVEDFAPEAWRMLAQLDHRRAMVNGYSSFFPPVHREFMFAMGAQFPEHMLACALSVVFHADLMIVDQDWLALNRRTFGELGAMLEPTYSDDAVAIFRMKPSGAECPPMRLDIGAR